jgi:predicted DNA-binding transcriptional regulator AlpA
MPARRRAPITIPAHEDRLISRREAAMRLDVSERTIERMERSGRLPPAAKISAGRRAHRLSTITKIIEKAK